MNYKDQAERDVRKAFVIYMEAYGYRDAKLLAESLSFQTDVYRRELQAKLEGKQP